MCNPAENAPNLTIIPMSINCDLQICYIFKLATYHWSRARRMNEDRVAVISRPPSSSVHYEYESHRISVSAVISNQSESRFAALSLIVLRQIYPEREMRVSPGHWTMRYVISPRAPSFALRASQQSYAHSVLYALRKNSGLRRGAWWWLYLCRQSAGGGVLEKATRDTFWCILVSPRG